MYIILTGSLNINRVKEISSGSDLFSYPLATEDYFMLLFDFITFCNSVTMVIRPKTSVQIDTLATKINSKTASDSTKL